MSAEKPDISGIVNLYKPVGRSSANYVYRLRRIFGVKKVGHAGTLDPFADGVLLGCVGRATKLVERIMALSKEYRTTLRLGVTNATYDTEQPFEPMPGAVEVSPQRIEAVLGTMIGETQQVPPSFSAVRIGGVPSYKFAKGGRPMPRESRPVRIERIDILEYSWPRLTLDIRCGRGTYIRAIARDLGKALECGACCESLTRRAVGPFRVEESVDLFSADETRIRASLMPFSQADELIPASTSSPQCRFAAP